MPLMATYSNKKVESGGRKTHLGTWERTTLCGAHLRSTAHFTHGADIEDWAEYARHDANGELCRRCQQIMESAV